MPALPSVGLLSFYLVEEEDYNLSPDIVRKREIAQFFTRGQGSVVGMATRYRLYG